MTYIVLFYYDNDAEKITGVTLLDHVNREPVDEFTGMTLEEFEDRLNAELFIHTLSFELCRI